MRIFLVLIFSLMAAPPALAWSPHLTADAFAPETLLVVDKTNQSFLVFSNKSPLRKEEAWQCTTGQAHGDKMVEGDLKTPEGIYFLERRLANNLPYELYGELAFTLNYPNPIDRIKNKTGHSIWIHGRGKEVVPYDTEGCVAMDMVYMLALEDLVQLRRTPVIITEAVSWEPAETIPESSRKIADLSREWARNWQMKSDNYFEHYDSRLFPRSTGQSFSRFRNHKQRLFRQYPWMDVYIEDPKVVKGPGYWVSYFGQVFKAPGFYSTGIKRLYWKQDEARDFRIVGEEWRPYPEPYLEQQYLLSREGELVLVLEEWRKAWLDADLDRYGSFYHARAVQNNLRGIRSIINHKQDLWGRGNVPETIQFKDIEVSLLDHGFQVQFIQSYASVEGYSDFGRKTLVMAPFKDEWLITSETWSEIR
ncbi:L,D-transpeptidase family protein [Desulfonatronovibrio hydrogenovorans]|uniref:L,D-transpeptidase family protein n=1 Tax=Desulfonatronovibrio hydrogenovorans TaxID=53245 RepID=UPI0004918F72|nr:L,D-transpeptidase family protein [Desulfonatronovibrio hydrogenovorans]